MITRKTVDDSFFDDNVTTTPNPRYTTWWERRGYVFIAAAIIFVSMTVAILVLIATMMFISKFATIYNRSNYDEVADLFDRIELYMTGNCMFFLDSTERCNRIPVYSLFYRFPDFSIIPSHMDATDIPILFESFTGQNPYVFFPLVAAELSAVACLALGIVAYRRMYRRNILFVGMPLALLLIATAAATGIANKIYHGVVPGMLNKVVTITILRDDRPVDVTGKMSDIGIRYKESEGMATIICTVVLTSLMVAIWFRWITKGKVREESMVAHTRFSHVYF